MLSVTITTLFHLASEWTTWNPSSFRCIVAPHLQVSLHLLKATSHVRDLTHRRSVQV